MNRDSRITTETIANDIRAMGKEAFKHEVVELLRSKVMLSELSVIRSLLINDQSSNEYNGARYAVEEIDIIRERVNAGHRRPLI